jgi:hypothetical protein
MAGIITLLTDFGLQDPYGGVMKGAIATLAPTATVIDLTHQIPPQDVAAARFALMSAFPYFPSGTVHTVVVDPGVGTARRAIAIATEASYLVGPDNGVFSGVLTQTTVRAAVALTNPRYWRTPDPSQHVPWAGYFCPRCGPSSSGGAPRSIGSHDRPRHPRLSTLGIPPAPGTGLGRSHSSDRPLRQSHHQSPGALDCRKGCCDPCSPHPVPPDDLWRSGAGPAGGPGWQPRLAGNCGEWRQCPHLFSGGGRHNRHG